MSGIVQFIGRPILEALTPAEVYARSSAVQIYRLREDFVCIVPKFGRITVPACFETDFASVPRVALWYVNDDAPAILYGAIVHDYLYTVGGRLPSKRLTREECDHVLRICMLACGARTMQAAVVYRAVRLGGGSRFNASYALAA